MNKKGISIMIGYILLISIAVVIGAVVFLWLKSYIPQEDLSCPDTTSVSIRSLNCVDQGSYWNMTLRVKNNGKFSIGGFFAFAGEREVEIANTTISEDSETGSGGEGTIILPGTEINPMGPNQEREIRFKISKNKINETGFIEITPLRFEEEDRNRNLVICGQAKVKENYQCS